MVPPSVRKLIDIGANLTDDMFRGIYNGSQRHEADLEAVLERAYEHGICKLIITGVDLESSNKALDIAKNNDRLYVTIGCHPSRCNEFMKSGDPELYLQKLKDLAHNNPSKVVAVGECGLDYDRLHFCNQEIQKRYFEQQLIMCRELNLPLFLHCRNAVNDFINIVEKQNYEYQGVVHSFDGSAENAIRLIKLGFDIGINGCSLKTTDNLEALKVIPIDKLMIETDCPWCEIRPSHAGYNFIKTRLESVKKEKWKPSCMVKSRNEPCSILQVLEIMSAVRNENPEKLCEEMYKNTLRLFKNIEP